MSLTSRTPFTEPLHFHSLPWHVWRTFRVPSKGALPPGPPSRSHYISTAFLDVSGIPLEFPVKEPYLQDPLTEPLHSHSLPWRVWRTFRVPSKGVLPPGPPSQSLYISTAFLDMSGVALEFPSKGALPPEPPTEPLHFHSLPCRVWPSYRVPSKGALPPGFSRWAPQRETLLFQNPSSSVPQSPR